MAEPGRGAGGLLGAAAPALATSLLFGGSAVAARFVTDAFSPLSATFLRFVLALAFLGGLGWVTRAPFRVAVRDLPSLILLGLLGVVGYNAFWFLSLRFTPVVNTAILNGLSPVITAALAAAFLGERLGTTRYAAAALSVVGTLLLISDGRWSALWPPQIGTGDGLMLVAVLSWTAYALRAASLTKRLPAFTITFYSTVAGVLLLLGPAWFEAPGPRLRLASPLVRWSFVYLGVAASGAGYLLYNASLARLGPSRTAVVVYGCVPIWVALLGWWVFDEAVTGPVVASATLVIAGLVGTLRLPPRA